MGSHTRRRLLSTTLGGLVWGTVAFTGACAQAQNLPGWFLSPPPDTAEAWFAVGEGPDPEAARRMALLKPQAGKIAVDTAVGFSGSSTAWIVGAAGVLLAARLFTRKAA